MAAIFNTRTFKWKKHVLFWIALIIYELCLIFFLQKKLNNPLNYFILYSLNISLFYAHFNVLNYVFESDKFVFLKRVIFFLLEMLAYLILKLGIDFILLESFELFLLEISNFPKYLILHSIRGFYFLVLATSYYVFHKNILFQNDIHKNKEMQWFLSKEKSELELNLAKTQNALLTHQTNPHLLFNTLSFIYNVTDENSSTAKGIIYLSEIMRYSLEVSNVDDKCLLSEELNQINNIIKLNELQLNGHMNLEVSISKHNQEYKIIPLILLTLVENLFKHGYLETKVFKNTLTIDVQDRILHYKSVNYKKASTLTLKRSKSLGMKNVIQRLNYVYGENYEIVINSDDEIYELELKLPL